MQALDFLDGAVGISRKIREMRRDIMEEPFLLTGVDETSAQVFDNISVLADAVGMRLQVEERDYFTHDLRYKYFFTYKGVEIFQLEKTPKYPVSEDAGADADRAGKPLAIMIDDVADINQ